MYIFYDFETSSRDLIGQIMTYAFIVTDFQFNSVEVLEGSVQLRSTELPDVDAILVNRIDITEHQLKSELESEVANRVFKFLTKWIQKAGVCTLVGFNSNQFDLGFLRNLLIHYGYNPYFFGKLKNLDILHFSQFLAFQYSDRFPWVKVENSDSTYYSFKLEDLALSFGVLEGKQTHCAVDDVMLLIQLVQVMVQTLNVTLSSFKAVAWHGVTETDTGSYQLVRVKQRHFANDGEPLSYFVYRYYGIVFREKKQVVVISLDRVLELILAGHKMDDDMLLGAMRLVNDNKSFFVAESVDSDMPVECRRVAESIFLEPLILSLASNPKLYYEKIKKDWDIDYQIHELGFDYIDKLRSMIIQLNQNPTSYQTLMQGVWQNRSSIKDRYLVQLFNRVFLWTQSHSNSVYLVKYLVPRYVTGKMLRNPDDFVSLSERVRKMELILESNETSDEDKHLIHQLYAYYHVVLDMLEF